jgi:hypothetical protein
MQCVWIYFESGMKGHGKLFLMMQGTFFSSLYMVFRQSRGSRLVNEFLEGGGLAQRQDLSLKKAKAEVH